MSTDSYQSRFDSYFARPVAQKAAKSIGDGAEMEFHVVESGGSDGKIAETFTFTKASGQNRVQEGAARDPQVVFYVTRQAAEAILADAADDVGSIGVSIAKLIVSSDAERRVSFKLKAGFLTLFSKGYLGVVTAGGGQFAAFLASKGLDGISGIKTALKKLKG